MYLPLLSLDRLVDIVFKIIIKSLKDKKEESKNGWYEHKKVEHIDIYYKASNFIGMLKCCFIRVSFHVLVRN